VWCVGWFTFLFSIPNAADVVIRRTRGFLLGGQVIDAGLLTPPQCVLLMFAGLLLMAIATWFGRQRRHEWENNGQPHIVGTGRSLKEAGRRL
jgi:hypothetical protein